MSVPVTSLSEPLLADATLETILASMNSDMIQHVTQFRKLQVAVLALENLVHSLGMLIKSVDLQIFAFIYYCLLVLISFLYGLRR